MSGDSLILTVDARNARRRLDVFLAEKLAEVSRSRLRRWIVSGQVTVDGRPQKPKYPVRAGNEIFIRVPEPEPSGLLAEAIPLQIVYEDDALIVVDKPSGMVVHPGAGNPGGTLANALLYHFQEISRRDTMRPGIVHRLDKATSGLLVVAKNEWVHEQLAEQFKRREVEKQYLALLYGRLEKKEGAIGVPLGRDPWARTRISTRSRRPRPALTRYKVIHFPSGGGITFSYVRVVLHTGRTHQVRVHFQSIGHPVVGDETYGKPAYQKIKTEPLGPAVKGLERHFLHAAFLSFVHPESGRRVRFKSPLPGDLEELLSILE